MLRVAALSTWLLVSACGPRSIQPWEYHPRPMADTLSIMEPTERVTPLIYEAAHGVLSHIGRAFSGNRESPALNADPFDEVVNSAWFTNRNAVQPLSPEQMFRGPQRGDGPDQSGPVTVTSIKTGGVSPGLDIEDAKGDRYILKFDTPERWEMESGAEVATTNLLWAAGYYTPENYVFHLNPSMLAFDDDLEVEVAGDDSLIKYEVGAADAARELTLEVFERHVLAAYPRDPDGTIRAMASKFLEGTPKGPFPVKGVRGDDPNDVIPHEHRRELRGLHTLAAWLNHVDTKEGNNLDMFIVDPRSPEDEDAPGIGYLRHNLIDFGSALGSRQGPRNGSEYDVDIGAISLRIVTLGIYERPWQWLDSGPSGPRATGYYQIDNFDPADWRPNMPHPAFLNLTARDGYWGAKLVMSFTDEQLDAALRAGRYSDPATPAYLLNGLKERRDATGRYWFRKVSPLHVPHVENDAVVFEDLWARHFGGAERYEYRLTWDAADLRERGTVIEARVPIPEPSGSVAVEGDSEDRLARLEVWKLFEDGERAPRPAEIWLVWEGTAWRVVGVRY